MNLLMKNALINYAKEYLKMYYIDISKYSFYVSMYGDVTATVECRPKGKKSSFWITNIYFNEITKEILQSSKPTL